MADVAVKPVDVPLDRSRPRERLRPRRLAPCVFYFSSQHAARALDGLDNRVHDEPSDRQDAGRKRAQHGGDNDVSGGDTRVAGAIGLGLPGHGSETHCWVAESSRKELDR
jgi:hypothetical protein